jgi:hypothetical protein
MAFKNLNDRQRRRALAPFLEAAECLDGHVVVVAVTKDVERLSTAATTLQIWKDMPGLKAKWDERAFEQMARIAHFFSLFVAAWSSPGAHVSWITDNDSTVANEDRLDDAHRLAAYLSSFYVQHSLGEFMMNTVSVDAEERVFEDFVAIADLAAGMVAEVMVAPAENQRGETNWHRTPDLTEKSDLISSWFWHSLGSLRKTCIVIDRTSPGVFGIGQVQIGSQKT